MRWVFIALLIINLAYGVWKVTFLVMQPTAGEQPQASQVTPINAPMTLQVVTASSQPVTPVVNAVNTPASAPSVASMVSDDAVLCSSLGPWQDQDAAQQAKTDLSTLAPNASIDAVAVQKQGLSWVYLPAYPTRDAALKALKSLQRLGVDSFVTNDGDAANAISLGYFTSRDSALGLQQRMQQAGFAAQVRDTAHDITEYWLNLGKVTPDALAPYLSQHTELALGKMSCQQPTTSAVKAPS